jgi:hypothetical protein
MEGLRNEGKTAVHARCVRLVEVKGFEWPRKSEVK